MTLRVNKTYIDINLNSKWKQQEVTFIKLFIDYAKYKTLNLRFILTILNFELYLRIR